MASMNAAKALHQKPKCDVCGEEIQQDGYLRLGTFDKFDFFDRPNFQESYEVCPHCGYVSSSISSLSYNVFLTKKQNHQEIISKLKELVDSYSYKSCKGIVEISSNEYRKTLYQAFLCYQVKGYDKNCADALIRLVWELDDMYMNLVDKINNDSNEKNPELCNIDFENLTEEEKQDLIKSKETIFKWVLQDYFKYVGEYIDNHYEVNKNRLASRDKDIYVDDCVQYVEMLITYIYYQRRFGNIDEAENKLNLLKELKENIKGGNRIRGEYILSDKVNFFYKIEYSNIQ